MYMHDAMQEYAKTRDDMQRLQQKAKKIAQLSQKLYQLHVLEETLNVKLKVKDLSKVSIIKTMHTTTTSLQLNNKDEQ